MTGRPAKIRIKDLPEYAGQLHHGVECLKAATKRWPKIPGPSRTSFATPLARLQLLVDRLDALARETSDDVRFTLPPEDVIARRQKPQEVLDVGLRYVEHARATLGALFAKRATGFQIGKGPQDNVADDVLKAYAALGVLQDELGQIQDALDPPGRPGK